MVIPTATLVVLALAASPDQASSFPEIVGAIRAADYRGDRKDLERLAGVLSLEKDPELAPYRHYWRGFALWRRAINGFNETPAPSDLEHDLKEGIASFQAALALKPGWTEAQIGVWGCAGPLVFLAKDDPQRLEMVIKEYRPLVAPIVREVGEKGTANPRALWLLGQGQLGGAGGVQPDPAKAEATFRRGLEAALAEARALAAEEPVWIPHWGGAENLMNLAYLYTHSTMANRDLALAYTEGVLVAVPEWHFVREILRPKILELPPQGSR